MTDVDNLADGMKVSVEAVRWSKAMLSELCVRRPVFATMLVTSLVVLGIFSFRDLGVDLFPKADPATVNVRLQLPGASPDEMTTAGRDADGERAQRHRRHRPADRQRQRRRLGEHHRALRPRARSRRRRQQRPRKSGRRDAERAARSAAADHPEGRSRRRADHEHRARLEDDDGSRPHRDRRQAGEARHRVGGRRRRRHA